MVWTESENLSLKMFLLKGRNRPANWEEDSSFFIQLGVPIPEKYGRSGNSEEERGFKGKTDHGYKESDG